MSPEVRDLFEALRPGILELGTDVVELFGERGVVYRVFDFFVEVIPRKRHLSLLLNLDFEACAEPSEHLWDATLNSFIPNATEDGGVGFELWVAEDIPEALRYVRQAYEGIND